MRSIALSTCVVLAVACTPQPEATTSYVRDIQPLIERSCAGCHQAGGIAPFSLTAYDDVKTKGLSLYDAIESARMPPFFASADCNSYEQDVRFSAEEKALLKTWLDEGAPKGAESEAVHAPVTVPPTIRHDVTMSFDGDYETNVEGKTDNYRCFLLDPKTTVDQLISGFEFMPGNVAVIHHMLAYAVQPQDVASVQALDDADPGQGYACSQGGLGVPKAIQNQVAGWVPGSAATSLPVGTGLMLKANSRIVMQLHYNTASLYRGGSSLDHSQLALELAPLNSLTTAQVLPMLNHNLAIKANDPESVQTFSVNSRLFTGQGATIYRAMGHMHQLGTRVRTEIVHPDGSSTCLLDVRGWDFNWQRDYTLKTPVSIQSGDSLKITCTYDNSAANQPYVNGVQNTPRDVAWGESSFDEMCMTYMTFTRVN